MKSIAIFALLAVGAIADADVGPTQDAEKAPALDPKEEYKKDFDEFDSNHDGQLDNQEIDANFKGGVDLKEKWEFFRVADTNHDGKVSLPEYIVYASDLAAAPKTDL